MGKALKLEIGQKFNKLTYLGEDIKKNNKVYVLCQCECGTIKYIERSCLINNRIKSCGCIRLFTSYKNLDTSTHGLSNTRIYKIWKGIKNRCLNKKTPSYRNWGGRGITICDEWKNDFLPFYNWSMSHGYSDELSIDRINNNGNYEPNNCRWATRKEQNRNTRQNTFYTYKGETHCLKEWSEKLNFSYKLLQQRIKRDGLSFEEAITKEVRKW